MNEDLIFSVVTRTTCGCEDRQVEAIYDNRSEANKHAKILASKLKGGINRAFEIAHDDINLEFEESTFYSEDESGMNIVEVEIYILNKVYNE